MMSDVQKSKQHLSVVVDSVPDGKHVFITGDCHELGSWNPEQALQLQPQGNVWSCEVALPAGQPVRYRYFIGEHDTQSCRTTIEEWETFITPRSFTDKGNEKPDIFGFNNPDCVEKKTDKGWLRWQSEIHLRLYSNPVTFWRSIAGQPTFNVDCYLTEIGKKDKVVDSEVKVSTQENCKPIAQPARGVPCVSDFVVFRFRTMQLDSLMIHLNVYQDGVHFGTSHILPSQIKDLQGIIALPIMDIKNSLPIGQISVDYLVVKPMANNPCDLSVSYAQHWNNNYWSPLEIGHRGMGSSYKTKVNHVRENSVMSMNQAGENGADMVEFDVVLTKDEVPVIYHDFSVCLRSEQVTNKKASGSGTQQYFPVPVHDLTFDELQSLSLDHMIKMNKAPDQEETSMLQNAVHLEDAECFPTLQEFFEKVHPWIGFDLEIKYCLRELDTGEFEDGLQSYMERNRYLNIILDKVLQYAGNRRIVITCFDPDACVMLRLKQNRYPVVFLTNGTTEKYDPYLDLRTRTVKDACNFALSERLLGVAPHSEDLFKDPSLVKFIKECLLILFAWGSDNNNKTNIQKLKDMGADAIIYDKIYELKESKENKFYLSNKH